MVSIYYPCFRIEKISLYCYNYYVIIDICVYMYTKRFLHDKSLENKIRCCHVTRRLLDSDGYFPFALNLLKLLFMHGDHKNSILTKTTDYILRLGCVWK